MSAHVYEWPRLVVSRPRLTIEGLRGRIGWWYVAERSIEENPDMVLAVMAQVIVLRAERLTTPAIGYLGLSTEFDAVLDQSRYPSYEWIYRDGRMRAVRIRRAGDGDRDA